MANSAAGEQAFLDWFKAAPGATVHASVGLTDFGSMGRGAMALDDIESDTLLFSIPRPILLTTSTSALPALLPPDAWSELGGWTPLILSMMYEYLRTETWKPYFALLPKEGTFHSLMFWSDDELAELKGSIVLNKIGRDEADEVFVSTVKPFVEAHRSVFGNPDDYTLELFHLCGSWVLSRSFHVDHKEEEEKDEDEDSDEEEEEREDVADVAMVPFADLLNAKSGCDNARLFYEPQTLNMMSTQRIPAGEQIFNTYADPPNSDLLRRYGHVDEVNDADLVEIGLEMVVDMVGEAAGLEEEERETRAEWLLEVGLDDTFSVETNHVVPPELVAAVKTFLLPSADFAKAQKKESPPKGKLDAPSAEWVRKILDQRLAEYDTSIEDDEALLQDTTLPLRKRMAVIVRLGEKRILRATRQQLDLAFPAGGAGGSTLKADKKEKKRSRDGKDGAGASGKTGKKAKVVK
ncbi:hypothetical protein JCM8097_003911 [Rhodosporidiobolus ruineniae]